jgi:hypothetical protein
MRDNALGVREATAILVHVRPMLNPDASLGSTSAISPVVHTVHTVHTSAHYMHTVHTVHTAKGPPCLTSDMHLESFCCIV